MDDQAANRIEHCPNAGPQRIDQYSENRQSNGSHQPSEKGSHAHPEAAEA